LQQFSGQVFAVAATALLHYISMAARRCYSI